MSWSRQSRLYVAGRDARLDLVVRMALGSGSATVAGCAGVAAATQLATSMIGIAALWVVCVGALAGAVLWAATPVLLSGWQATVFAAVADVGVGVGLFALSDHQLTFVGCMLFVMIGAFVTINVPPLGLFTHTVFVTSVTLTAVALMVVNDQVSSATAIMGTAIWLWVLVGAPLTVRRIWVGTSAEADMASYDPLTGVLNRTGLDRAYRTVAAAAATSTDVIVVVVVDLDDFKAVNDHHGHHVGDAVIVETARTLVDHYGHGAAVARSGGEEFTIVAAGDRAHLTDLVLRTPTMTPGHSGPAVTMSIGATTCTPHGDSEALYVAANYADKSMYRAKNAGGKAIRIHNTCTAV